METDIFICVETATRKLVAIDIEPRQYVRKDDPYFTTGVRAYINQEFPPMGTILTETQVTQWAEFKTNENERDTLYKLAGPKISTSVHIDGFKA